ncbi:hypothetical protein ACVIG9_006227 [Bradyrhizobium ottawaense]
MKVADSPEIAVRLGSASVRMTPALSIARMVALTVATPLARPATPSPLLPTIGPPETENGLELLKFTTAVPAFRLALRSTPSCLTMSRRTSPTTTLSITWSRPRTTMLLTTLSEPPTSFAATSPACWASTGLDTDPVSITLSPTPSIWTPGSDWRRAARMPLRSRFTAMS